MNEKTKIRLFLLFFCALTFFLALISLANVCIKEFIVFYSLFAYYFLVMLWEETKEEQQGKPSENPQEVSPSELVQLTLSQSIKTYFYCFRKILFLSSQVARLSQNVKD